MKRTNMSKMGNFTKNDKFAACNAFFEKLTELLGDRYEVVETPTKAKSLHLVPIGTADELTYHSKPAKSFRASYYWNWYANLKKNDNPYYIQCLNADLPRPSFMRDHERPSEEKASRPVRAAQVAVIGDDGKYHAVFGEVYHNKKWCWLENDPAEIAKLYA